MLMLPLPQAMAADNLSLNAGADGSSKAGGTSYGNVKDGNTGTYWSPNGATGYVSVKWSAAQSVSRVNILEAAAGRIGSWSLKNGDTGAVLKTGSGAGVITFTATSLKKVTFEITKEAKGLRAANVKPVN